MPLRCYVIDDYHRLCLGTAEDYKLLEQMNRTTITKYSEMKQIAVNIHKAMVDLNDKCKWKECSYHYQLDISLLYI